MQLSHRAIAAIVLCVSSTACKNAPRSGAEHVTEANISLSSTLSALPRISAASNDGQATELFVDPGTEFAMDAATVMSVENPNKKACDAALKQLADDRDQLRRTNEWQVMMTSPAYVAVVNGIKQVRRDDCHSAMNATVPCQVAFETLNKSVGALWKSSAYQALEQTSEYAVLQNDANAIARIGSIWKHCADTRGAPAVERVATANASTVPAKYDASKPSWQWQAKNASLTNAQHHQRAAVAKVMESRHHARRHRHDHNRGYGARS